MPETINPLIAVEQDAHEATQEVSCGEVVVIDTSALVADPAVLYAFPGHRIVLPLTVIEELDGLKTRPDAAGANARFVVRALEELRVSNGGSLVTAVPLRGGASVRIEPNGLRLDELNAYHLAADVPDHRILASALGLAGDGNTVRVVSCDGAMRLKADALGLRAADHLVTDTVFKTSDHPGWSTHEVDPGFITALYRDRRVDDTELTPDLADIPINEFLVARSGTSSALARRRPDGFTLVDADRSRPPVWGVRARNKEQRFVLDLLTDPDVAVVALSGPAGTGKSLLAIAAALQQTFERDPHYDRVMILRPMFSIGRQDLGFLPGDVAEKVAPWFDAVVDAMVALSDGMDHKRAREQLELWVDSGQLTMEPVTFLRGRSLSRTLVILDEVQNLEAAEVKTVLTRLGEGSKIVMCGDVDQCDNPFTTPTSNGLSALVSAFRGQDLFGHIALTACERSRIAGLAADLL